MVARSDRASSRQIGGTFYGEKGRIGLADAPCNQHGQANIDQVVECIAAGSAQSSEPGIR